MKNGGNLKGKALAATVFYAHNSDDSPLRVARRILGRAYKAQQLRECEHLTPKFLITIVFGSHDSSFSVGQVIEILKHLKNTEGVSATFALESNVYDQESTFAKLQRRWPTSGVDRLQQYLEASETKVSPIDDNGLVLTQKRGTKQYYNIRYLASYHLAKRLIMISQRRPVVAMLGISHAGPIFDFLNECNSDFRNGVLACSSHDLPRLPNMGYCTVTSMRGPRLTPLSPAYLSYRLWLWRHRNSLLSKAFRHYPQEVRKAYLPLQMLLNRILMTSERKPIIALMIRFLNPTPSYELMDKTYELVNASSNGGSALLRLWGRTPALHDLFTNKLTDADQEKVSEKLTVHGNWQAAATRRSAVESALKIFTDFQAHELSQALSP